MKYIIRCSSSEKCNEFQIQLFEKGFSWASGTKLLDFGDFSGYFPLYLIVNTGNGNISWDAIKNVESNPAFRKELRKLKIKELQNAQIN